MNGKVAIVTGASRGIGRAIAIELAHNGSIVIVNYAGNEAMANETVDIIKANGGLATAYKASVVDESAVNEMIKYTIEQYGKIDFLINNAGITKDTLIMRMKESDWDSVIDTNLKGVFLCSKAVTRQLFKQKSGKIVNISSVVGISGNIGQANYVAAKAGVIGLTKTMAREFAARGINVNAIAPGFIETDMTDVLSEDIKNEIKKQIPLEKLGQANDIAKAVKFLCSDDANYITGQVLVVDGGMVM